MIKLLQIFFDFGARAATFFLQILDAFIHSVVFMSCSYIAFKKHPKRQ